MDSEEARRVLPRLRSRGYSFGSHSSVCINGVTFRASNSALPANHRPNHTVATTRYDNIMNRMQPYNRMDMIEEAPPRQAAAPSRSDWYAQQDAVEAFMGGGMPMGSNQEIRTGGGRRVKLIECHKQREERVETCPICVEEIRLNTEIWAFTNCCHRYHFDCLKRWLEHTTADPKCCVCNTSIQVLHRSTLAPALPLPRPARTSVPASRVLSGPVRQVGGDVPHEEPPRDSRQGGSDNDFAFDEQPAINNNRARSEMRVPIANMPSRRPAEPRPHEGEMSRRTTDTAQQEQRRKLEELRERIKQEEERKRREEERMRRMREEEEEQMRRRIGREGDEEAFLRKRKEQEEHQAMLRANYEEEERIEREYARQQQRDNPLDETNINDNDALDNFNTDYYRTGQSFPKGPFKGDGSDKNRDT